MTIHNFSFIFADQFQGVPHFTSTVKEKKKKSCKKKTVNKINVGCKNRVINYNKMAGRRNVMQL